MKKAIKKNDTVIINKGSWVGQLGNVEKKSKGIYSVQLLNDGIVREFHFEDISKPGDVL